MVLFENSTEVVLLLESVFRQICCESRWAWSPQNVPIWRTQKVKWKCTSGNSWAKCLCGQFKEAALTALQESLEIEGTRIQSCANSSPKIKKKGKHPKVGQHFLAQSELSLKGMWLQRSKMDAGIVVQSYLPPPLLGQYRQDGRYKWRWKQSRMHVRGPSPRRQRTHCGR